jgi:hypothetical protein
MRSNHPNVRSCSWQPSDVTLGWCSAPGGCAKRKTESELTKACEALIFACADGDVARVKAALSAGATIDREGSQLPLVEAARHGHVELFRWLLYHGADALKAEANGDTALFEAARNGHVAITARASSHFVGNRLVRVSKLGGSGCCE